MAKATERKSIITTTVDDAGVITFTIKGAGGANEHGQPTDGTLVLDPARTSEAIRTRAMRHGFIQRVSDKAAIPCDTTTGKAATPAEKMAAMAGLVGHFMSGSEEWSPKRAEGAGRKTKDGLDALLLAAVCEATGKSEESVRASVAALAESRKAPKASILAVLAGTAMVAPIVERLREEQASATDLEGDELLEGLLEGLSE